LNNREFAFSEQKRRFKVIEANSQGITVISVDKLIECASTLTIDGKAATDFETVQEDVDSTLMLLTKLRL
jgi:hypothetical protein